MNENKPTVGEQVADHVVSGMGSWRFILIQTVFVIAWILLNSVGWWYHWDPPWFILLNLLFSTQAAYASPIILLSGNRTAAVEKVKEDRRIEAEQAQMTRIEALEQVINEHIVQTAVLIREIHQASPGTGCSKHSAQLICAQCFTERRLE